MKKALLPLACLPLLAGAGCATVTAGARQEILFDTAPSGGVCSIVREGVQLYADVQTPAALEFEKDKDELAVTCRKEGYWKTTAYVDSSFQEATAIGFVFGGFISLGVDMASGAMNDYPKTVTVELVKL